MRFEGDSSVPAREVNGKDVCGSGHLDRRGCGLLRALHLWDQQGDPPIERAAGGHGRRNDQALRATRAHPREAGRMTTLPTEGSEREAKIVTLYVAAHLSAHGRSRRSFWRHFIEMDASVMLPVDGPLRSGGVGVFALLGHGNLLHFATLRGALMTIYMVGWNEPLDATPPPWLDEALEMSAAMIVPDVLLVGPSRRALSRGVRLGVMHIP